MWCVHARPFGARGLIWKSKKLPLTLQNTYFADEMLVILTSAAICKIIPGFFWEEGLDIHLINK